MRVDSNFINNPNFFDLLIIGAGPAGLTAALYAKRANLKVGFYEKETPGGKVVKTAFVENYPGFEKISGPDLALNFFKQTSSYNIPFLYAEVTSIIKRDDIFYVTSSDGMVRYAFSVILATGMSERKINIPGESEYYGKGVSYCAICDASLYRNKKICVLGGGNSALEEALYLTDFASELYLIHRREEFRAEEYIVKKVLENKKIIKYLNYVPIEFVGDKKAITSIKIQNVKDQSIKELETSVIFPFFGFIPNNALATKLDLETENGFIKTNSEGLTSIDGLYCCGDLVAKATRQIANAVGEAAVCATSAKKYVTNIKEKLNITNK